MNADGERAAAVVRDVLAEPRPDLDGEAARTVHGRPAGDAQADHRVRAGGGGAQRRAPGVRRPGAGQNHRVVHRWLLERNLARRGRVLLDHLGDIYLAGRLAGRRLTAEVDQLLGVVAETADDSFDPIVALGFADSIRREWVWRRSRGESTANLAAFTHSTRPRRRLTFSATPPESVRVRQRHAG